MMQRVDEYETRFYHLGNLSIRGEKEAKLYNLQILSTKWFEVFKRRLPMSRQSLLMSRQSLLMNRTCGKLHQQTKRDEEG